MRGSVLAGGITLILVGYLASGITGTIGGSLDEFDNGCRCRLPALPSWPFAWVPFLHPFMALGGVNSWGTVAGVVGAISSGMEIAGLIMAVVGQIGSAPEPAIGDFSFRLGAPNADGGVSGVLTF